MSTSPSSTAAERRVWAHSGAFYRSSRQHDRSPRRGHREHSRGGRVSPDHPGRQIHHDSQTRQQIEQDYELAMRLQAEDDDEEPGRSHAWRRVSRQREADPWRGGSQQRDAPRDDHRDSRDEHRRREWQDLQWPFDIPGERTRPNSTLRSIAAPSNPPRERSHRQTKAKVDHPPEPARTTRNGRPAAQRAPDLECKVCFDNITSNEYIFTPCGHHLCRTCVEGSFRTALSDRERFPPRCCPLNEEGEITLKSSRRLLPADLIREFKDKAEEWGTPDGTYCHVPGCSAFIPSTHVDDYRQRGTCPKCRAKTCTACKLEYHRGMECPEDPGQCALEALAEREGWKACPSCGVMVERVFGCNHMKYVTPAAVSVQSRGCLLTLVGPDVAAASTSATSAVASTAIASARSGTSTTETLLDHLATSGRSKGRCLPSRMTSILTWLSLPTPALNRTMEVRQLSGYLTWAHWARSGSLTSAR